MLLRFMLWLIISRLFLSVNGDCVVRMMMLLVGVMNGVLLVFVVILVFEW